MSFHLDDCIVAVASPPGPSARGIIRVSGREAVSIAGRLLDSTLPQVGPPVRIVGRLLAEYLGTPLPAAVLVWPTTRSYTGQPMAEFHVIGSPPILDLVVAAVINAGARPAERGEFTMRAFLHGRIDLLQAEAVLGVIDAADHNELQAALTQLGGGLTQQLQRIRSTIIAMLGDLEAGLDFVEEDIEFISSTEMVERLNDARTVLQRLFHDSEMRLPSGYRPRVVIAGLPNAGKSTLFNRLANAELAIASTLAGTTRDYLSCPVRIENITIELVDTAGWDSLTNGIMTTAGELRQQQIGSADLVLWCRAADLRADARSSDTELRGQLTSLAPRMISVVTCSDRVHPSEDRSDEIYVSALSGTGLNKLRRTLVRRLTGSPTSRTELLATTSLRCRDSIQRAIASIDSAVESANCGLGDEITAIGLRETLHELRSMLGETCHDDILDHIFSNFCIGK